MIRRRPSDHTGGFTIIEFLIAMSVFSVVLLIVTVSVIRFSNQYYRGVITTSTQGTARNLIEDVVRSIEYSGGGYHPLSGSTEKGYCVGSTKRYSYVPFRQIKDTALEHGLVSDSVSCTSVLVPPRDLSSSSGPLDDSNARELLGNNMRVLKFDITNTGSFYTVTVRVAHGDDDVLTRNGTGDVYADSKCVLDVGMRFCAVSELTTTVKKRVSVGG